MSVLVVNAGSSSLKYRLVGDGDRAWASGQVERIGGDADGEALHRHGDHEATTRLPVPDHAAAFRAMLDAFAAHGPDLDAAGVRAVGHRVVHGGTRFTAPVVVDDAVEEAIEDLAPLAPLHNPAGLRGIRVAREALGHLPQVAVFDTAFHATLPDAACTYAVPAEWRERHGVRRFGFHGISHRDASRRARLMVGAPERFGVIVLHLGNGSSACAVRDGISVETSMGLTPLEGLVMGTRSGDVDPAVVEYLCRTAGMTVGDVHDALIHRSGLAGLAGTSDFRDVERAAAAGDPGAILALDVTAHRLVKYVGAYAAVLGRLDAVVFTGGIGFGSATLRRRVIDPLGRMGLALDPAANRDAAGDRLVSASGSVPVLALRADEESEIARQVRELLDR